MDPQHLLIKIVKILNSSKIPYLLTGGMAIYVWGRPRFTADIDMVIELKREKVKQFIQTLIKEGYIDEGAVNEALKYEREFNFIDPTAGIKVDFWILKNDDFDKSRLERRVAKKVLNQKVYFTSAEDLILVKLLWFKESKSTRHLEDIHSIMEILKDQLDFVYLRQWAKKHNNLDLLEEMVSLAS